MSEQRRELLHDLHTLLCYQAELGVRNYAATEEVARFLRCRAATGSVGQRRRSELPQRRERERDGAAEKAATPEEAGTIAEIEAEVRNCRGCSLIDQRVAAAAGSGGSRVKLFIVGGWLTCAAGEPCSSRQNCVFGEEEDRMLERMLAAIKLPAEEAFVTNVIKCGIDAAVQPRAEHITACLSYLERQIRATRPRLICTMGITAARTLVNVSRPLSALRGRFHQYRSGGRAAIPLLATYHPTFLLQNPEMKKATWADLQLIARKLQEG